MPELPQDNKTTVEERERYGREINALSAAYENVEVPPEPTMIPEDQLPPPLTEEEIRRRVGDQNFDNIRNDKAPTNINS